MPPSTSPWPRFHTVSITDILGHIIICYRACFCAIDVQQHLCMDTQMDRWKETHTYTVPPNVPGSKSLTWWLSGDMFLTHRNELLCGLHVRKYLSLYVLYIYIYIWVNMYFYNEEISLLCQKQRRKTYDKQNCILKLHITIIK